MAAAAPRRLLAPRYLQDSQDYDDRNLPVPETDSFSVYLREVCAFLNIHT